MSRQQLGRRDDFKWHTLDTSGKLMRTGEFVLNLLTYMLFLLRHNINGGHQLQITYKQQWHQGEWLSLDGL